MRRLAARTALGLLFVGLLAAPNAMAGEEGGSCPGMHRETGGWARLREEVRYATGQR